jgi:hypothetical protein
MEPNRWVKGKQNFGFNLYILHVELFIAKSRISIIDDEFYLKTWLGSCSTWWSPIGSC